MTASTQSVATKSDYDILAPVYDRFLGTFSQRVVPVLDRLLLNRLPGGASALDVCCGTGQLAAVLTQRGLDVTGVDLSEGMLEFARRNSPQSCFVQADVCSVKLPEKFDAAVSTFDSLNHLPDLTSLGRCFRSVATALKPGARFLFDLNMQLGFELRWWARATLQVDELSCEIEADYRTGENQARNNVRILRPDGSTDRCFSIVENCWPEEAICQTLRQSGFRSVRVFDGHADAGLWGEIGRSFFLATVEDTAANPAED